MIVLGSLIPVCLVIWGNVVRRRISATSAFRRSSSPSSWPDFKCVHTKQKLVWWRHKLTDTAPCTQTHYSSLIPAPSRTFTSITLWLHILQYSSLSLSHTHTREAHLVSKVVKDPTANTAHFYVMDMTPEVWANPNCDEDANHLLAHKSQELILPMWRWKCSMSCRNRRCKRQRFLSVIFCCGVRGALFRWQIFFHLCQQCRILQTTHFLLKSQVVHLSPSIWQTVFRRQERRKLIFSNHYCIQKKIIGARNFWNLRNPLITVWLPVVFHGPICITNLHLFVQSMMNQTLPDGDRGFILHTHNIPSNQRYNFLKSAAISYQLEHCCKVMPDTSISQMGKSNITTNFPPLI